MFQKSESISHLLGQEYIINMKTKCMFGRFFRKLEK